MSRVRQGEPVSRRECPQDAILVVDETLPRMRARTGSGHAIVTQDQHRQRLVLEPEHRHDGSAWPLPFDALDIEARRELRKRGEHPLDQRAMPAVEALARKRGILEAGLQEQQPIARRHDEAHLPWCRSSWPRDRTGGARGEPPSKPYDGDPIVSRLRETRRNAAESAGCRTSKPRC